MDNNKDAGLILSDKTGALLMLNKEERKLLKELLLITMSSKSIKNHIIKRLGTDHIQIAEKLLKVVSGLP